MKRITVKIGSNFFIDKNGNVNRDKIRNLVQQISQLKAEGFDILVVSSGAIAVGTKKMKLSVKPHDTAKKQALAAIGQMTLMQEYELLFDEYNLKCAQILVCHDDFGNRNRVNCLQKTLNSLFDYGVVPVVNENDAVATNEIKVGDNDTLSAMMSLVISSDLLILVSDIDGLYSANPKTDKNATLIPYVEKIDNEIKAMATSPTSEFGTGGMQTKIKAAIISTEAGIPMLIINQTEISSLYDVCFGKKIGTFFKQKQNPAPLKKCWLGLLADVTGEIKIDNGAKNAILTRKSLLICGITDVLGQFESGKVVSITDENGIIIAKGITSFDSTYLKQAVKKKEKLLHEVIHANNIALCDIN